MNVLAPSDLLPFVHRARRVSTDTRTIGSGDMFVALKGPRFDGNQYATKALESGAAYVVVDDSEAVVAGDERYLLVENGLKALQQVATLYRKEFDIPFFGLTGSNGKTTTKELIYSVLSQGRNVHATAGNFNNHIGVPLTLLATPKEAEIAIIEMGTNQPGDIQELTEFAEPTHGLITNVGAAHLEKLGDLDGVKVEKGSLFDWIRAQGGTIFLNEADQRVIAAAKDAGQIITYGTPASDFSLQVHENRLDGMRLAVQSKHWEGEVLFETPLSGAYNAHNILAAISVGHHFGLSIAQLQAGIAAYQPDNHRSQLIHRNGRAIWMDAYNANPTSMQAAISHLFSVDAGRVGLILGDMYEVGDDIAGVHHALGEFINGFEPAVVIGVGERMAHLVEAVKAPAFAYKNPESAIPDLEARLEGVDTLLIKGSRGIRLEKVLEALG